MTGPRSFLRCTRGTAAVEFAFIGMMLFLSTIGLIEVGRALFMFNELSHAADRAARRVMLEPVMSEGELLASVRTDQHLTSLQPEKVLVTSPVPPASAPFRRVALSYDFTPMISGLTIGAVTLSTDRQIAR